MARIEALLHTANPGNVSLTNASLDQNTPNPFNSSTVIRYNLPLRFGRAKLQITDISGRVIKSVGVSGGGRGSLNVNASGLSSGVYNYTLYVDDQMVNTRQMLITK